MCGTNMQGECGGSGSEQALPPHEVDLSRFMDGVYIKHASSDRHTILLLGNDEGTICRVVGWGQNFSEQLMADRGRSLREPALLYQYHELPEQRIEGVPEVDGQLEQIEGTNLSH